MECIENLREPARAYGVELSSDQTSLLSAYLQLLVKWNKAFNLTGTRKPEELATRHILDSLTVSQYLRGSRVIDVGSGAGFPGIPLAIARPEYHFVLLDSNTKKTRFLQAVIRDLSLANVQIATQRLETHRTQYPTVVSRALGKFAEVLEPVIRLAETDGRIIFMAGHLPEPLELSEKVALEKVHAVQPPVAREKRHLICLRKLY